MSEAAEGAGLAITGALLAREAERAHAPGHDPSDACANCGAALTGPYCHACGQHGHVHRTAGALVHDILHGVFHFEGKFWATVPLLALRPGELTRRYARGERAKFVSPMAIFLFSVFLLFAVVANLPGWSLGEADFLKASSQQTLQEMRRGLVEERARAEETIADLRRAIAREREATAPDMGEIRDDERKLAEAVRLRASLMQAQRLLPAENARQTPPSNWLSAKWEQAKANPQLLLYKVKTSAYKFSWALIPISLPFIWLLFPLRRDVGLYDHAIFATYSLSFMSLLVVALALLGWAGVPPGLLWLTWSLIPPIHIYRQLKGAYGLGRLGALWRTAWMLMFATLASGFFILLLLYLGLGE